MSLFQGFCYLVHGGRLNLRKALGPRPGDIGLESLILGKLKQEDFKFKRSLRNLVRICPKIKDKT